MNIEALAAELGLKPSTTCGSERIYYCPICTKPKLYVSTSNGSFLCHRGCARGGPWDLAEICRPDLSKREIWALLDKTDCLSDRQRGSVRRQARKQLNIETKKATDEIVMEIAKDALSKTIADDKETERLGKLRAFRSWYKSVNPRPAPDDVIERFAKLKGVTEEALRLCEPMFYIKRGQEIVMLPVHDPGRPAEGKCGCIRAALDGSQIPIGPGKTAKYASKGLLGLYATERLSDASELWWCEGFGDMLKLMSEGLAAITTNAGAKTWRDTWTELFRDRQVFLVFDRDKPGQAGQKKVFDILEPVAASVTIVELPYKVTEDGGKDVRDYFADGHTVDELRALAGTPGKAQAAAEKRAKKSRDKAATTKAKNDTTLAQSGVVKLDDAEAATVARSFEQHTAEPHHWNRRDGWSEYSDGQHRTVYEEDVESDIQAYVERCVWLKGKEWSRVSTSANMTKSVRFALRNLKDPRVYLLNGLAAPCSLDGALDVDTIIPVANGLLDISTWPPVLRPASREFYTLSYLPYDWDPGAHSDMWDQYLVSVTQGNQDLMDLMQLWAGYCLWHERGEQIFMVAYGKAGTGKSQFEGVLKAMLGDHNVSAVSLSEFSNKNSLYRTYQKRLNASDEADDTLEKGIENKLKSYVSGGEVGFKTLYKDEFDALPTAKVLICCDKLPHFQGNLESGVWRRLVILPFKHEITQEERIKDFAKVMARDGHMPAVLTWALKGLQRIKETGQFPIPEVCGQMRRAHQEECMPEIEFFRDHFEAVESDDPEVLRRWAIPSKLLVEIYNDFMQSENRHSKAKRNFIGAAKELFKWTEGRQKGATTVWNPNFRYAGIQTKCWAGLCIKQESEYYDRWVAEMNKRRGEPGEMAPESWDRLR